MTISGAPSEPNRAPAGSTEGRTMLGHPVGLFMLFGTEMWERFSFYSMRAFLVLYMTKALLFSQQVSSEIYGAYLGFVYAAPFVGGMLADRLLGQRRAIVIGAVLMAFAQFTLAAHALLMSGEGASPAVLNMLFFVALALLAAGNGFFKPNISSIVGALYERGDARRDSAFTIFYMGINVGALGAGFSGQIAESISWHWGFLMAGAGMLLGLLIFLLGGHLLMGRGLPPRVGALVERSLLGLPNVLVLALGVAAFIPVSAYLMAHPGFVQGLAVVVAVPIVGYLVWEAVRSTREERDQMFVVIILCSFSMLFWAFFELAGSAINLFTDAHVQRTLPLVGELKASLLTASTNPLLIVLLAPLFSWLWIWLERRRWEPASPLKFALGLLQLGAGFLVLYFGAAQAGETGRCNILYLTFGFLLHTTGELCLSPVGLSTMTKLAPARLVSTVMGVWFLFTALGNVLGGWVGGKTEQHGFGQVFFWIAVTTAGASVLLFLISRPLKRMMHGVK